MYLFIYIFIYIMRIHTFLVWSFRGSGEGFGTILPASSHSTGTDSSAGTGIRKQPAANGQGPVRTNRQHQADRDQQAREIPHPCAPGERTLCKCTVSPSGGGRPELGFGRGYLIPKAFSETGSFTRSRGRGI